MNWKKPVFVLGAVLACTSLLAAAVPPTDMASSPNTISKATLDSQVVKENFAVKGVSRQVKFDYKKAEQMLQYQSMARTGATLMRGTPVNDMCADAIEIFEGVTAFDTTGATTDGPDHPGDCEFGNGETYNDIWYTFNALETGTLQLGTCNDAAFDTDLVIYDGCDCGDLILLGCDDDTPDCDGYTQVFEVEVVAGNCYLIRLGSYDDEDTGIGNLTLDILDPPTGACCIDGVCTATVEEADCAGEWYIGEDCNAGYICPGYCPEDELEIIIYTDEYASETTWTLSILGGEEIASGDPAENLTQYNYSYCLDDDLCYEFTIYDTASDGICCGYGDGWYQLWLNGEMVFEGGEFGAEETTEVGSNCVEPMGACCVDVDCVATTTEADCDATYDGRWFAFEDCATYVCQPIIPGDECEDAVEVNAPYPVSVSGTSIGMEADCPSLLEDWYGMWYEFELPFADNDVTIQLTAAGMDNSGIIVMDDCACDDYVVDNDYVFDSGTSTLTLHFRLAGPGYWFFPAMAELEAAPLDFTVVFNVEEHPLCVVPCEPNEGEEDCYDGFVDVTNGGCNMATPAFSPIACGETVCGTSGTYYTDGNKREMDWFQITLDNPGEITWSGIAEFPFNLWILSGECGATTTEAFASVGECEQNSISAVLPAGTYMLIAAPSVYEGLSCGLKYEVTLACEDVYGACCYNDGYDCVDTLEADCASYEGDWYIGEECASFDCPLPCTESQIDVILMTDDYASETSWQITDAVTGAVICEATSDDLANATLHEFRCCIGYNDCVDFTIYDSYGDGICCAYGNGYYEVYLDGVLEGSGAEFSDQEVVGNIGGGCIEYPGACCVDLECVATNYEADCDALGGRWFINESCPEFECPMCYDYDVTAPYVSDTMTTCGMGDDCSPDSQSYDTEDIVFRVTIPYDSRWSFNTCLLEGFDTWLALGTDCCLEDIAYNDDACSVQSEIIAELTAGVYYLDVEGYDECGDFILEIADVACEVVCPEGASIEGEPCGDDTNGGCNMATPSFEPIGCNETVCGTIWADGGNRDTDWYEIVATADDTYTWTVEGEFDMVIGFIEQTVPGVPGCDNTTGYLNPYTVAGACEEVSVSIPVTAGGTYYGFVSHQTYYDYPCDTYNDYVATLTGDNCGCGDLDADGDVDVDDFWLFLDSYGTCVGDIKYIAEADLDGDECITLIDYGMWMQCYRDANGGRTFVPQFRRAVSQKTKQTQGSLSGF